MYLQQWPNDDYSVWLDTRVKWAPHPQHVDRHVESEQIIPFFFLDVMLFHVKGRWYYREDSVNGSYSISTSIYT